MRTPVMFFANNSEYVDDSSLFISSSAEIIYYYSVTFSSTKFEVSVGDSVLYLVDYETGEIEDNSDGKFWVYFFTNVDNAYF